MTRRTRTAAAAVTGTVALGVGLGIAGLASAAPTTSPSPSASPSASSPATPGERPDRGGRGLHGDRDGLAQSLADALGVDVAEVRTALQDYRQANRSTTKPGPGANRTEDDAALAKALAGALDVDEAKVTTALAEIRSARQAERAQVVADRLAEAVEAGALTRSEADAVQKAADAGIVHVGR